MRGGLNALLLISALALCSCATTQTQDGPPPSPDSISYFIYAWDKAERNRSKRFLIAWQKLNASERGSDHAD